MPRRSKGPALWLKKFYDGRPSVWIIRDRFNGQRKDTSTGLGALASEWDRRDALSRYLNERHDPTPKGERDPNQALVSDCLSVYLADRLERIRKSGLRRSDSRQNEARAISIRLIKFFGTFTVSEINGQLQKSYAKGRGSQSSARRDLIFLAAAINSYTKHAGGLRLTFSPLLPDQSSPRERWLTRHEAARLIRAAWRARQTDRGGGEGRFVGKHVARSILVALYTGSRSGSICDATVIPTIGRTFVDLDRGVFVRKALGAKETNKKAPTIDLPPRLLAHMRRWWRLGISNHSVIEWNGKPVKNAYHGFIAARDAAGLGKDVVQHTLRHTAVSWYVRAGVPTDVVGKYIGMSEAVLRKTYAHHMPGGFNPIISAGSKFGRTGS